MHRFNFHNRLDRKFGRFTNPNLGDAFAALLAEATFPVFTNTRAGARKSVFEDYESARHLVSTTGNTALDGSGSCVFDGSGGSLTIPDSPSFWLDGDFTIEVNLYNNGGGAYEGWILGQMKAATGAGSVIMSLSNGKLRVLMSSNDTAWDIANDTGTEAVPDSNYTHLAITREGNTLRTFVAGVKDIEKTIAGTPVNSSDLMYFGLQNYAGSPNKLNADLSRVHIAKGVARYTDTFTPPARTDDIVVDKYTVLALDMAGDAGSTTITDSAIGNTVRANTPDTITTSGVPIYSSLAAATNLVSTVVSDWTDVGAATTTDNGDYSYRITATGTGGPQYSFVAATDRYVEIQMKVVSGSITSASSLRLGGQVITTLESVGNSWTKVGGFTSALVDQCYIRLNDGTITVDVKYVRVVTSTAPAAAFADGSAAGEAYPVDILSASPSWGAAGTIFSFGIPYGWEGTDIPSAYMYMISLNGTTPMQRTNRTSNIEFKSWDAVTSLLYKSTNIWENGTLTTWSQDWNGTNVNIRWEDEAIDENVNSTVPSGTLQMGGGSRSPHMAINHLIFDRVLTDAEYETLRVGIQAIYGSLTLI